MKTLTIRGNAAIIAAIEDSLVHDTAFWRAMLSDTYGIKGEDIDTEFGSLTVTRCEDAT